MIGLTAESLLEHKHPCLSVNILTAISLFLLLIPVVISLLSFWATTYPNKERVKSTDECKSAAIARAVPSTDTAKKEIIDNSLKRLAFYGYIHEHYPSTNPQSDTLYLRAVKGESNDIPSIQTARQIVDLARVCHKKFKCFNVSIIIELPAIIFWGVTAIIRMTT